MNYELAKQLKDAGFPIESCSVGPNCEQWWYFPGEEAIHAPTLEELIAACGENLASLQNAGLMGWFAWKDFPDGLEKDGEMGTAFTGSTPSEAVANLWLALNKKDG